MLTPSGEFDRQVIIERNVPTRDSTMGGEVPSWETCLLYTSDAADDTR